MPSARTAAALRSGLALALALGALVACSGDGGPPPVELLAVPEPDLSAAVVAVRDQVAGKRARVEELRGAGGEPAALAEAYADLGLIYVVYDFLDAAGACFENARRADGADFRWHYLHGYVLKAQGRLDEAVPALERALELRPDFWPAALRLARARLDSGDTAAAEELFRRVLAADPDSAAALEGLGKVAVSRGDDDEAVRRFERALELEPAATRLNYLLGQAYRRLGRVDEARARLERSGDAGVPIRDPLISPLAALGASAQFYLVQGAEALTDERYEDAAGAYRLALEQDATSFIAHKGLAYALEKLGDIDGAMAQLRRALDEGTTGEAAADRGERAELHRLLGGLEALRGRDLDAIAEFRRSLELAPGQAGVELKLANALARTGSFAEAVGLYDRVLAEHPEHAAAILVLRATALVNLGRGDEALADFRQALEERPDDGALRLQYAEALEFLGRGAEAARQRARAGQTGDEAGASLPVLVERAASLAAAGRHEEAAARLAAALELAPDRHDLRHRRAALLGHLGRYDEAVAEFRRVLEEAPRHAAARRGEVTALILAERYGEARVRLNETMRIFPRDAAMAHVQARLLATAPDPRVRDGRLAMEIAQRLDQAVPGPRVSETLALARAASGDLAGAAELQRRLVGSAETAGDEPLAAALRRKLEALERGDGWWAASPQEILDAALGVS